MKILYFCSTGPNDPTKCSVPFHLAVNGSVATGQETSMVLGGDAVELLLDDSVDKVEGVGLPPLRELVDKVREHSVPVYV